MNLTPRWLSLFAIVILGGEEQILAGERVVAEKAVAVIEGPFSKGMTEVQLGIGGYFSIQKRTRQRPELNTVDATGRIGWMCYSPKGMGIFRGNYEFLLELSGGAIVEGPGDFLGDLAIVCRYNFVQPDAKWVPYFQVGAGLAYSNVSDHSEQRIIGQDLEFNLQGALGLRYLAGERWAAFIEGGWRHVSNADLASRNLGLNSIGGLVGVSFFF